MAQPARAHGTSYMTLAVNNIGRLVGGATSRARGRGSGQLTEAPSRWDGDSNIGQSPQQITHAQDAAQQTTRMHSQPPASDTKREEKGRRGEKAVWGAAAARSSRVCNDRRWLEPVDPLISPCRH